MNHCVRIYKAGGPENLVFETFDIPAPGAGEVRIRQEAIGVNFLDVYHRIGLNPLPLPAVLGTEGAGVVVEVGAGVTHVKPGDRVAYAMGLGAYATERNVDAGLVISLPDFIDFQTAAAVLLKGTTAEYLLHRTYRVTDKDTILFHAAAGGVGTIACQWAKALGARVIGTVSSQSKADVAHQNGCTDVIVLQDEDFVARVSELTDGKGAQIVYDGVGKTTFSGSLECLARFGMLALFGQSSGAVAPIDPAVLSKRGIFLSRPALYTYNPDQPTRQASANALFEAIRLGHVKPAIDKVFALKDVIEAHSALESRRSTGSMVLVP